jgi:hypothetical protein
MVGSATGGTVLGLNLDFLIYAQQHGYLPSGAARILDIGPQNVYFATEAKIRSVLRLQGQTTLQGKELDREIERLVYFSTPRPEERTTLLSEITDLTAIDYHSFDVAPALKTEILDLNTDKLPPAHRGSFDLVLNFGTTEHIFNQWNCFEVMHDAAKVSGVIFCQLPGSGYLEHGYFTYTPLFFRDLVEANDYELCALFSVIAGLDNTDSINLDVRHPDEIDVAFSSRRWFRRLRKRPNLIPSYNINSIMRKKRSSPFRCWLEVATTHAAVDEAIAKRYGVN